MPKSKRNKWKRYAACFMLLFIFLQGLFSTFFTSPLQAREADFPDLSAETAVLMEFSSGQVIYAKNADEPRPPASLTKIMTLLLVYDALDKGETSWDEQVTISEKAWATGGSQMFLEIDQQVTVGELITGIATISANDACVAISEHLYGSEELFVREMNRKAREMELQNTQFQNTSGLHHEEHFTSAMDMAQIAHYFIQNYPESLELHAQEEYIFNEIRQYNRNPLLGRYPGADGLKTGHTSLAGYCLVGTASQDGMRFITVVMDAPSNSDRLSDSETMLNYAFRNYSLYPLFEDGEIVGKAKVSRGEERYVDIQSNKAVEVVVPFEREDEVEYKLETPESIPAKVEAGTPAGHIEVSLDGEVLQTFPLFAASDVEEAGMIALFFRAIGDFFSGIWGGFTSWLKEILPFPME